VAGHLASRPAARDEMPPFQINVGRQPQGKQGALMHKHADGTLRDVQFNLSWPSLTVTARGGEALNGDEIVKNSVVRPLCNMDGPVQGRNGFCFQCTLKSKTLTFFAASPQDRDAWCVALRNHAAHHNLANAFEVSSRVLGTGAYAKVLAGKCKVTGAPVALKIIPRSRIDSTTHPAAERTLLSTEMQLGMELRHELCTKTIEFIENAHQYVIVMELMGGGDLFEFLRRRSLTEGEVQCLMRQVLVGLQYMHSRNIGHFDLKPENLLLSQEKPMTVKLCDFGISLDLKRSQPSCYKTPGMLRATPGYGAPEVVKQQTCGLKVSALSAMSSRCARHCAMVRHCVGSCAP